AALLVMHRVVGLTAALLAATDAGSDALLRALRAPGIGRGRAVELAVNAVLPFLMAIGAEAQALALADALPAADPVVSLIPLDGALLAEGVSLSRATVLAQQGALALHEEWCRRGGCGVCPLSWRTLWRPKAGWGGVRWGCRVARFCARPCRWSLWRPIQPPRRADRHRA